MMLQALIAYAERENLGDSDFEETSIHWLLPLDGGGNPSGPPVQLLANPDARRPVPKKFPRPFTSPNELSQGGRSHFLADSLERVLLFNPKDQAKAEGRRGSQSYFKKLIAEAADSCAGVSARCRAVVAFWNRSHNSRPHGRPSSRQKPSPPTMSPSKSPA